MKHFTAGLSLAFALLTTGGGGSQKPKAPAGPTCADVAVNTEKQMLATGAEQGVDMASFGAMAREIIGERCTADAWSKEAIACLAAAGAKQMEECAGKLTPAQNEALENAMKARIEAMSDDEKSRMMPSEEKAMAPPAGAASPRPDDPCGGDE